jgi:hypothetical protein
MCHLSITLIWQTITFTQRTNSSLTNCTRTTQRYRILKFVPPAKRVKKSRITASATELLKKQSKLTEPKLQAMRTQSDERNVPYVLGGRPRDVDVGLDVGDPLAGRNPRHCNRVRRVRAPLVRRRVCQ